VLVLCYHAVSERWPAALSVTPEALERQAAHLVRHGYRGATLADALGARRGARDRTVVITFDDAYRSVLDLALPILGRHGLPATVFAPTAPIDAGGPMAWPGIDGWLGTEHEAELTGMGWDGLTALREAGWEVGSHTRTHPRLTGLDDAALDEELRASRAELEARLGAPCRSIAYPYGDVDARVIAAAGRAGYQAGVLLPRDEDRLPVLRPLAVPRIHVDHIDTPGRFARQISRRRRALRRTPFWPALLGARLALRSARDR